MTLHNYIPTMAFVYKGNSDNWIGLHQTKKTPYAFMHKGFCTFMIPTDV